MSSSHSGKPLRAAASHRFRRGLISPDLARRLATWWAVTLAVVLVGSSARGADETKTAAGAAPLARDGRALLRVVVASDASATIDRAADDLATQLSRIADAKFEVVHDATAPGIRVGLPTHFRGSPMEGKWQPPRVSEREDYLLQSHDAGVWILGATDEAVRHAAWDFLHRLGYRQFFPGERWEVVPRQRDLRIALDTLQSPSYSNRRIWYGFGAWDYAKKPYAEWNERNRMGGGIELSTGHAYDGIVKALAKEFEQHPEYWPLLGGERKPVRNPKPCLGNAELRAKIVRHAVERFEKNPSLDSVSMDPSDGGGWCECDACAKLGTVSDQALTLANEVAQAINAKFPDK
ncbi:MAG TPA: DUF4838 domain-containing protein, partial [Pirellulaceae bacterium]|nr:DUF4838 domain-containing protein [Pirellulaceae bacterium]